MSGQIPWLDYAKELLAPVVAKGEPGDEWDQVRDVLDEWMSEEDSMELSVWLWTEHPDFMEKDRARSNAYLQKMAQSGSPNLLAYGLMKSGIKLQDAPPAVQAYYSYIHGEGAAAEWDRRAARLIRGEPDDGLADELEG